MNSIVDGLVGAAATLVILNQVRAWRAGTRIQKASEHFEKASGELEAYQAKVQKEAVRVLGLLREATYQAQTQAELREDMRIDRKVPDDLTAPMAVPSLRPKTPAQRARADRERRGKA